MTPRQRAILRDLARCKFYPGSFEKRFVHDLNSRPDDYPLSEKQAAFLDKTHHRYREQIQNHWEQGCEVWNEPEEDPDDIEMNRLAYEALYPEERDRDCPYCGRRRDIPETRDGRLIYRCAFCDFGSVNVTEDDEDYEDYD